MSPGYVMNKLGDKAAEYMKMSQDQEMVFATLDEMLNMSKEWTSLDSIWDMVCLQFKDIEPSKMIKIVKDFAEAGIIESRSV
jgi:hypothetical protein